MNLNQFFVIRLRTQGGKSFHFFKTLFWIAFEEGGQRLNIIGLDEFNKVKKTYSFPMSRIFFPDLHIEPNHNPCNLTQDEIDEMVGDFYAQREVEEVDEIFNNWDTDVSN